ncbi:MAG: hypothetical protein E7537_05520 [Ruminococcaceae bacterium]|nr:hypothetical protein [Oscillospiraceae bacterium]
MPEYKRKRRGRFSSAPKVTKKRTKKTAEDLNIPMTSAEKQYKPRKNMRVVKGKKLEAKRRFKLWASIIGVVMAVLLICELFMPAGVFETASNTLKLIGGGSYPIDLESNNTSTVVSKGSYYYVLSSNSITAFSNSGKKIFTHSHGFENPVIKTSKTRALVFDQGKKDILIFTLDGLESSKTFKHDIKTAAIGDNGTYAVVTSSENYTAQVSVFKKNNQPVYEWFSSVDLVNNVGVSPSGKKIAVATISSKVGGYNSKVSVLNFKSATPENEKIFENTIVYALDTTFGSGFSVITANSYNFFKWSNFKSKEYKNEYNSAMFRTGNNGLAVVFNRENDKTDNRIAVFSSGGKLKKEFEFKGIITDFAVRNGNIYCVSDTKAYVLGRDGKVIRSGECGFGVVKIVPFGQNIMAVVTDNEINKLKLEQE